MSKASRTTADNPEQRRRDIEKYSEAIFYSARYSDEQYEYRHVILPKALVKYLPTDRLAEEDEWRGLGIRQSPGWEHYMRHAPEPHILLFKREKDYQIKYPN
ncbi:cyclin-dependent kinase regulatory subunit [Microbotryum lychnidis-dioicae p1A1 Lamole]|uniref:Cyclin-dependent kinases regulatory subunit n=1 Tax=Microbotryum lychnidis-dioicae (strain p1A1 Lamole / MvSl-1064) TaxID=683840 RepID=U5HHG9_USTV1|nr:cyclin-dependent kinase regulatory subunit [Microbotryum lychnidis-dioicae p1A1 Lamole]|eukprot:KDE02966.1 cyclin-dependent kinase regulatory subunit [Microbotryum lychnidis-dioicae p1A1 Lamole]